MSAAQTSTGRPLGAAPAPARSRPADAAARRARSTPSTPGRLGSCGVGLGDDATSPSASRHRLQWIGDQRRARELRRSPCRRRSCGPIRRPGPPRPARRRRRITRSSPMDQLTQKAPRINVMEGSTEVSSWLRCYRCWSQNLEVQVHYEGIHRIDPETGERGEVVDEMQEAVVQCLECMHDQPHLGFHNGRVEPIEDRWERMIAGTPVGGVLHGHGRRRRRRDLLRPRGGRRAVLRRVRRSRHPRVLHPRALPQARRGPDRRASARRALRAVGRGGHRGARGGRPRPAGDHLAGRRVASAGLDGRR